MILKKILSFILLNCFVFLKVLGSISPLLTPERAPIVPLIEIAKIYQIGEEDRFDSILNFAQTHFLQRTKERWEFSEMTSDKIEQIYAAFEDLGCVKKVHAKQNNYTYALVLGSTETNMTERISFLINEWEHGVRFSHVVLLSGERPLDPQIEPMASLFTTESDLMNYLWNTLTQGEIHSLPVITISSPMKSSSAGLKRPTTADTVIDWMKMSPIEGSCIAVSSQPFVPYQESVLQTYLPPGFAVETIDPKQSHPFSLSLYLDTLAKWMFQEKLRLSQE